ncbi:transmembrane protein 207 [Podarcis muralis]
MRNLPFGLDHLLVLQTGQICLALAQGILYVEASGSEAECESADRCDVYEEQSLIAWYIWFYISLSLAAILLCIAACCLQRWLKRRRLFSSQRTVAVFALSDADSGHKSDGRLRTVAPIHPHPQWSSSDFIFDTVTRNGPPPSYEEIVKPGATQRCCSASRLRDDTATDPLSWREDSES